MPARPSLRIGEACLPAFAAIRTHVSAASRVFPDPPAPVTTRSAEAVPVRHHACRASRSPLLPANGTSRTQAATGAPVPALAAASAPGTAAERNGGLGGDREPEPRSHPHHMFCTCSEPPGQLRIAK